MKEILFPMRKLEVTADTEANKLISLLVVVGVGGLGGLLREGDSPLPIFTNLVPLKSIDMESRFSLGLSTRPAWAVTLHNGTDSADGHLTSRAQSSRTAGLVTGNKWDGALPFWLEASSCQLILGKDKGGAPPI